MVSSTSLFFFQHFSLAFLSFGLTVQIGYKLSFLNNLKVSFFDLSHLILDLLEGFFV